MVEKKGNILQRFFDKANNAVQGDQNPKFTEYSQGGGAVTYITDRKLEERLQEKLYVDQLLSEPIEATTLKEFLEEVLRRLELLNMEVQRVASVYLRAGSGKQGPIDSKMLLHGWGQLYQSTYARGVRKLENYGTDELLTSRSINAIHVRNYYRGLQNVLFKKVQHVFAASWMDIDVTVRGVNVLPPPPMMMPGMGGGETLTSSGGRTSEDHMQHPDYTPVPRRMQNKP